MPRRAASPSIFNPNPPSSSREVPAMPTRAGRVPRPTVRFEEPLSSRERHAQTRQQRSETLPHVESPKQQALPPKPIPHPIFHPPVQNSPLRLSDPLPFSSPKLTPSPSCYPAHRLYMRASSPGFEPRRRQLLTPQGLASSSAETPAGHHRNTWGKLVKDIGEGRSKPVAVKEAECRRRQRHSEIRDEVDLMSKERRQEAESCGEVLDDDEEDLAREEDRSLLRQESGRHDDFPVHVVWKLWLDGINIHSYHQGHMPMSQLESNNEAVAAEMNQIFTRKSETAFKYDSRKACVKSKSVRGTKKVQTLTDLESEDWAKIEEICEIEWAELGREMELIFEIRAVKIKKSSNFKCLQEITVLSDPIGAAMTSPQLKKRKT